MFLPSKHLLSAFYKKLPSNNPSKNLVFTENPLQVPSKNPSKKHLLLENLLRTLLRSVRLHDPLGVHPSNTVLVEATFQGETIMHQAVVAILCLLRSPFCKGNRPFSGTSKETAFVCGKSYNLSTGALQYHNCPRLPTAR